MRETEPLVSTTEKSYQSIEDHSNSHIHHHNINESDSTEESNGLAIDETHAIGLFGSFVLIMNNLTGPAMLGFPALFQQAGILPVFVAIVFVCIASSFCSTFLADSIASIPGNAQFRKNVDFSSAFKFTVGSDWYVVAEALFLMACAVQACAGIVGAAQSLDGFLASFLLGKTYALQIVPHIELIEWTTASCSQSDDSSLEECTPFADAGPLILTLGFVLTSCIFVPLGRGHLEDTIVAQVISFVFFVVLLVQFSSEFTNQGLDVKVNWIGDDLSQLAGVVLFNYAFSITVPAWLSEKSESVSVNKTIWSASVMGSIVYLVFGIMGAMAFTNVSPNILILLSSSKVHWFTRLCGALFGVTIIGCGVPVFSVIIRNALTTNKVCSAGWAQLWGAYMPYMISWMLYQGSLLMSMLNWTGLVVNGLVAFILPMVLALKSTEMRASQEDMIETISQSDLGALVDESLSKESTADEGDEGNDDEEKRRDDKLIKTPVAYISRKRLIRKRIRSNDTVHPIPRQLEIYRKEMVLFMILAFTTMIIFTIMEDIINGIEPS